MGRWRSWFKSSSAPAISLIAGRPPREQPQQPPREQPERPIETSAEPAKSPHTQRRSWLRWALFALLPLALIGGGYWYVTGGRVVSTDNAYVEADKVGISTRRLRHRQADRRRQ